MSHTKIKNQKSKIKNSKGISLLFIVLITGIILAIALGLCAILIQEMRLMTEIGYSVSAFYAADNGIEEALYDLYQSPSPSSELCPEHPCELNDAQYQTVAKCCPDSENCAFGGSGEPECPLVGINTIDPQCNAKNYCLKSRGSYKGVKRAIEINY
jgi:hypothetical protein